MRQKLLEEYKKTLKLSPLQKDVLVGLILGDGHIELSPNRKAARLKVEYTVKNYDYAEWLYQIFRNLVRMPLRKRTVNSFGADFIRVGFTTLSIPDFLYFRGLFYKNKTKIIPLDIDQFLTNIGLTVWFMDDGSYKSKECRGKLICTHNFKSEEIDHLCQVLKDRFGLEAIPRKQIDGIEIYIRASSFSRLEKLVLPYLLPSFYYKIGRFH